ncbi:MAG: FHA domain-containing protein [Victivallaceae bacterium]|nr:FHA domain-containing protein [Victivallaceae bacterium]
MAENPKFTVLYEKLRGKTFDIDKETMSIGRRDGMDICIKDPSLSGHHADIIRTERDGKPVYILRDNDSTNGTKINNVPLTGEAEVKNSDLILFGMVEVLFDCGAAEEDTGTRYSKTQTIDISSLDSNISNVSALNNLNPFAMREEEHRARLHKINLVILAVILLCLAVLAGWVVFTIFRETSVPAAHASVASSIHGLLAVLR